jgi:hypothetical protein
VSECYYGMLDAVLETDEIGLGCRLDCSGQVKLHRNTDLHELRLLGLLCQGKIREIPPRCLKEKCV